MRFAKRMLRSHATIIRYLAQSAIVIFVRRAFVKRIINIIKSSLKYLGPVVQCVLLAISKFS